MNQNKKRLKDNIRKYLSEIIGKEVDQKDFLITVTYADFELISSQIKIGISVIPDNRTGTAIKKLNQKTGHLAEELKKSFNLGRVPYLKWVLDNSHKKIFEIEEKLKKDNSDI